MQGAARSHRPTQGSSGRRRAVSKSKRAWTILFLIVGLVVLGLLLFENERDSSTSEHEAQRLRATGDPRGAPRLLGAIDGRAEDSQKSPEPPAETEQAVDQEATRTFWVRGHVVADQTGADIEGARAVIAPAGDDLASILDAARTDETGGFKLPVEGPAPVRLIVMKDGYATLRVWATPLADSDGAVPPSIRLEKGQGIRARVVDASGDPVPGADVWCVWTRAPFAWPRVPHLVSTSVDWCGAHARTGPDGYCALWGLQGRTYEVHGSHPAYRRLRRGPILVKPSVVSVVLLKLVAVVDLRLSLIDARTRKPVALRGGTVDMPAFAGLRPGAMTRERRWGRGPSSLRGVEGASTIPMSFSIEDDADEDALSVTLLVDLPGYERRRERIALRRGVANTHTLELEPLAAGRRSDVLFRLTSPAGRAFGGRLTLNVKHADDRTSMRHSVTFRKGIAAEPIPLLLGFCTVWLTAGEAKTVFWIPMAQRLQLEVTGTPGSQTVNLPVRGSPVRLRVEAADGRRVRGYALLVEGRGPRVGYTDGRDLPGVEQGDILWLSPGTVALRIHDPARGLARIEIEVPSDGPLMERTVVLDPAKAFDPSRLRDSFRQR